MYVCMYVCMYASVHVFDGRRVLTRPHCHSLWQCDKLNGNDGQKQHQCGVEVELEVLVRNGGVLGGEGRGGKKGI